MSSKCNETKMYFDWDLYVDSFASAISVASSMEQCADYVNSLLDNLLHQDCEDFVFCSKLIDFVAVFRNSEYSENRQEDVDKGVIAGESAREQAEDYYKCVQVLNAKNFLLGLRRSDSRLLRLFLKYGIDVLAADRETEKEEIMNILKRFCYYAIGIERVFDDAVLEEEVFDASNLIAEKYYKEFSNRMDPEEHTRLMQILFGVEAVLRLRRGNGTHQAYVNCVRMYFRDVAWPFMSTSEVRFVLGMFGFKKPLVVESFCRDFAEIFPEFQKTPRSLKEICRAEVRDIIKSEPCAKTLPVAVSALTIPHTLKNYLLGEE